MTPQLTSTIAVTHTNSPLTGSVKVSMGGGSALWCDQLMTHRDIVTCDCDARRLVTHPQLHQCYVTLLTYRVLSGVWSGHDKPTG